MDDINKQSVRIQTATEPNSVGFFLTPFLAGLYKLEGEADISAYSSRFQFLSPTVENILFDGSTSEFIAENLGTKFNLSDKQKEEIANIIREIILGDLFIGDMEKSLRERLGTDENTAKNISSSIAADLFPTAVESITRIQRVKFADRIKTLAQSREEKPVQQPSGMGDSRFKPEEIKNMPLTQPGAKPLTTQPSSSMSAPQKPAQSQPQQRTEPALPPLAKPSVPDIRQTLPPEPPKPPLDLRSGLPSQPVNTPQQRPGLDASLPAGRQGSTERSSANVKPLDNTQSKPQFKIPDLGKDFPPLRPETDKKPLGGLSNSGSMTATKDNAGQDAEKNKKSLEEELEKVANVIDLRTQPKE